MATRPRAGAEFFKGHGLGNDYIVFSSGDGWLASNDAVRMVCDRWRGLGSDGIVVHRPSPSGAPFRLRMFNPDGTEFERSGNGLRIFGAYAASRGWVGADPFAIEVGGDEVSMRIEDRAPGGVYDVSVDMGTASLHPSAAGLVSELLPDGRFVHPELGTIDCVPVAVGNPHCVVFTDDLSEESLSRLGPFLSTHPAFPGGVNVQLARPLTGQRIQIAIWERGVGRTSASGTSSCAAATAAVHRGLVDPGEVEVRMEGGLLRVDVREDMSVVLRGPVQEVATGRLAPGFVDALAGLEAAGEGVAAEEV